MKDNLVAAIRITFMACIKFNATYAIVTARKEHCDFYCRFFGHEKLTEPRLYPGLIKPVALLLNDFRVNHQPATKILPYFAPQGDDLEQIFDRVAASKELTR